MRALLLPLLAISLSACAGKLPAPDPQRAWIEVHPEPSDTLMANRLDGKRWNDGRYFQVDPGTHELEVRYQFEIGGGAGGMGGMGMNAEPSLLTCYLEIRYDGFSAGQRYRLEARNAANQPMAWLYDEQRKVLARNEIMPRCGPF
ncbi:hypothetical protein D3880_00165 [Pseudomonas cavernae]|uniref:Lipoprotein n=1 Tax=Pseudomonas cavernae TaxID=2320867 RepID=A0A385YWH5_9PSED|nr:hypothetical protein [Pseudomonas cavernae]AYC30894.1 hypothetical protein D3880_00165 [Pseudomonas cavernae]